MNAPFYSFGFISDNFSLAIAFLIGISFGFFLESGGLGDARKLTAQFYFSDMTVFKVMFTAIITTLLGLFWLSWFGLIDLSQIYITPTFVLPQLIGGLIFGAGFVIGGLCPGTSCVAISIGKIDGLFLLAGLFAGIILFGESFPLISEFYNSTSMGKVTLYDFFNVSMGAIVFSVVIIALAGFKAAEWSEKKFGNS